nr:open rectifier potassium channel protein 1 [Megalopta genalis]
MSKKQWIVLLMLFLTYLLLGASMFYHIESPLEMERVKKANREREQINELLHKYYMPVHHNDRDDIFGKLSLYCGKSVGGYGENETDYYSWDFYNSFYFAYTVVSTIGYGNLAPTNMLSRILMIFYGLIGIPINGILLSQLGEFFGHVFVKAHQKYKSYKNHARDDYCPGKPTFETRKLGLAAQILVYLTPGFVMFIFFPAFLFSYYEKWSYDEAVYYAFVTLTTIGFGDYVAGQDNRKGEGFFFVLYKAFLICWISFGLGYIVMIMTFIARGMRSKQITRIEHKLAVNLKHTQSKIWNEFNKEIDYLRRVFNELQLSKVKRVYVDECSQEIPRAYFPRSHSFPDLRDILYSGKGGENIVRQRPRRRANSEVVPTRDPIARVVSETDLQRIDKTATFASHAIVQPAELLARLVNILGYMPPATDDLGGDCSNQTTFVQQEAPTTRSLFSSRLDDGDAKDVLASEKNASKFGGWTVGPNDRIPRLLKPRSRAASEVRLYETKKNENRHAEWTWSGATASRTIQELMKARMKAEAKDRGDGDGNPDGDVNADGDGDGRGNVKDQKFSTKLRSFSFAKSVPKALISSGPWKHRFSINAVKKPPDSEQKSNAEETVVGGSTVRGGLQSFDDARDTNAISSSTSKRNYYTYTGAATARSETESCNLLEETSLADFVRALSFLQASVATTGSWAATETGGDDRVQETRPQRKMGIASLSPPKLPSLFTLFSSSPAASTGSSSKYERNTNGETAPGNRDTRRGSLAFGGPQIPKPRRFSLRPVVTPTSPPTPPRTPSPFLPDPRQLSHETKSTFLFDSPKEPLIRKEGAPGLSSPIMPSAPNQARRFSLRPTQNQATATTEETATTVLPMVKPLPRWKAGMLQRQIGQKNLRRRVRAFSLSDVHVDDLMEKLEDSGPLSRARETSNLETVPTNSKHAPPRTNQMAADHHVVSTERTDQSVPSTDATKKRYASFTQAPYASSRPVDKTVRIVDSRLPLIDRSTISNESSSYQQQQQQPERADRERGHVIPMESSVFGSFQNVADEITLPPLMQVKVENPVAETTASPQGSSVNATVNTRSDDSIHLRELKIEKPNSRSNVS